MNVKSWILLKKHGALPVLILAVVVLIAISVNTYEKKDHATFRLKDVTGSRVAIADVVISGELRDGYHSVHFSVEDGVLRATTDIFQQPEKMDTFSYFGDVLDPSVHTSYTVSPGVTEAISVSAYTWKDDPEKPTDIEQAAVTPLIHYKNNPIYSNKPLTNGLAKIGDKVYFTPVLFDDVTGTSGIYLLKFGPWGFKSPPKSVQIAEINLDANKLTESPNIAVLGLESAGDKLALLTVENYELVIRSYDSVSGKVLGEATVPDFRLADGIKPTDPPGIYDGAYSAFNDPEQGILNLDFKGSAGRRLLLSVGFKDGVQVVNSVLAQHPEDGGEALNSTSYLRYKNGKLYAIETFQEPQNASNAGALHRPEHFYLYVYQQSNLIYRGELVTDWNDDREFDNGVQGIDPWFDDRDWDHVSIN